MNAATLLTIGPLDARLRCECCDLPSVRVRYDKYGVHLEDSEVVCQLCDWENTPLTREGSEVKVSAGAAERNDGISLAQARANFSRFLSMYDPQKLEPWMLGPPSEEVLARKRELRDAYIALLAPPGTKRWDRLNFVKDLEAALESQVNLERERAQET